MADRHLAFKALADAFSSESDSTPALQTAPHGDFNTHPNATMRIWLGPLGSCSRDLDGRQWCTKPSYFHPKYNISTIIQPNAYLYPGIIQSQTLGKTTLAFIVLAAISCILSVFGNIGAEFNIAPIGYNLVIAIAQFVTLWIWLGKGSVEAGGTDPRHLNTVDRLFQCNQTSGNVELMDGPQYYVLMGNHYGLLWTSWVLTYVLGSAASALRAAFLKGA